MLILEDTLREASADPALMRRACAAKSKARQRERKKRLISPDQAAAYIPAFQSMRRVVLL